MTHGPTSSCTPLGDADAWLRSRIAIGRHPFYNIYMVRQRAAESPVPRRVAVLAGSSLTWREQVMRGIASYANAHGPWHVYTAPETAENSVFFSDHYKWDGLIVRPTSDRFVRRIVSLGVPAVGIGSVRVPALRLPRVKVDDDLLTRAAAAHLISGGLRRFAYCGFFPGKNAEDRGLAFAKAVEEKGYPCSFYSDFAAASAGDTWQKRQRDLARWVKKLEKPVGIITWNPDVGCQLIEACHSAGVKVPDDVAIVSADDDKMKCELTRPTLSAMEIPAARIGYEAAALLDSLMQGGNPPAEPILLRPAGVVTVRESSDTASLADRDVHQALQFIREHAAEPISVDQVARAAQVSRRWLERHFRRVIGRSPHEQILQARLDLAKRLLLETDWPASRIATASGFSSASYLNCAIRRDTGMTPIGFRKRYRLGDG
jgi:LacI family transcriptional regulator